MKQLLSITFIFLFSSFFCFGQTGNTSLKGKVTDKETGEGIAFVSIGIEGTFLGTASNPDGLFELRIPDENLQKNLYFSAIGYKNISFPITDFSQKQDIAIALVPQSYKIEEVSVAAESQVLQRILRTVSEQIPTNYLSGPANLKMYYEERESIDNSPSKTNKYIVDLYDASGYSHPSWADAYKNRKYQITESQTETSALHFQDASNNLDEILEMDIARLSNSILNPKLLNDFELKMEARTLFDGDSVWIVSYEATKLDLVHTGSYYPTSFQGKIYIRFSDYAVLRNEIKLAEYKSNPQGRSLAVKTNPDTKIQMNITIGYKKVNGKFVPAFIDSEKHFTSASRQSVYESGKAVILEVSAMNTKPIKNRDYVSNVKTNENFWKNFVAPTN
ncbi:MAG: carboxypeptidase-like regulatory domain-containing protein [Prolixibacteraceae bacterium]|jgi:hypothetical protein